MAQATDWQVGRLPAPEKGGVGPCGPVGPSIASEPECRPHGGRPPGTERGAWGVPDGSARAADATLGGPPASRKDGDMDRAGRSSVE